MDPQKVKQDHGNVRWDGPRLMGIAPDLAPQEIDSPLFATNMTPSNAADLVRRWNAYPEAELRINELIAACEELLRHANGIRGEWADPLGTAEEVMNEAKSFRAAIANATNTH